MRIDEKDRAILDVLRENAKLSTYKIAKKTTLPVTTIHNRIKKLEREGVIRQYSLVLDHAKLGHPITAYVLIQYDISIWNRRKEYREELRQSLLRLPDVSEIKYITGSHDIMLKIRLKDMSELNNILLVKLRKIPGVGHTETIFVLEDIK